MRSIKSAIEARLHDYSLARAEEAGSENAAAPIDPIEKAPLQALNSASKMDSQGDLSQPDAPSEEDGAEPEMSDAGSLSTEGAEGQQHEGGEGQQKREHVPRKRRFKLAGRLTRRGFHLHHTSRWRGRYPLKNLHSGTLSCKPVAQYPGCLVSVHIPVPDVNHLEAVPEHLRMSACRPVKHPYFASTCLHHQAIMQPSWLP